MKKKEASEASEMVEISSEEDGTPHDKKESKAADVGQEETGSPTKPGENPQLAATESGAREDAEYPSSNPTGPEDETLTKPEETPTRISFQQVQEADVEHQQPTPTAHEEPSRSRKEVSEGEDDEEIYQLERKRKGKALAKKKKSSKKPSVVQTAVVIREPEETHQKSNEASSDEDYTSDEEPASEDDVSLEDEEFQEQLLENDHRELVHPPIERIEYLPWQVELDDDLLEKMMHFDTQKLKDAFEDKDDGSKQVKCGKVLHHTSLNKLAAREPFLSHMHAVGFGWLLNNGDPIFLLD